MPVVELGSRQYLLPDGYHEVLAWEGLLTSRTASRAGLILGLPPRTRKAMGGALPFKDALTERLALIQPSREQVQRLLAEHPPHLTPGIR